MPNINDNDLLIIICSKNPNEVFTKCIDQLRLFYKSNILVVDSDSDKNLEIYDNIKNKYENIEISLIKNKNWEYGAYKYGFNKYPNYKMYLCFQESILLKEKIKLEEKYLYLIYTTQGWSSYRKEWMNVSLELIKNTELFDYYNNNIKSNFLLCQHNSFIFNNNTMKDMFNTLIYPPKNKIGEMAYERLFGLFIQKYTDKYKKKNNYIVTNIRKKINKVSQKKN